MSGGILSYEDIVDRCVHDAETGCLSWAGATKGPNGRPVMHIPAIGRSVGLSVALHVLLSTERWQRRGLIYHQTCGNQLCCALAHQRLMSKSQINEQCHSRAPITGARISAGKRMAGLSRLTPEQRAEIRGSSMLLREIVERHGISMSYACTLRSGRSDVPRSRLSLAPGLAAGASVFAWAGDVR